VNDKSNESVRFVPTGDGVTASMKKNYLQFDRRAGRGRRGRSDGQEADQDAVEEAGGGAERPEGVGQRRSGRRRRFRVHDALGRLGDHHLEGGRGSGR